MFKLFKKYRRLKYLEVEFRFYRELAFDFIKSNASNYNIDTALHRASIYKSAIAKINKL